MKLKNEAKVLRRKALSSLRTATTAFNSPHDEGRTTQVLLSFQHAFEMLLKAALVQNKVKVFDRKLGRSIGFEECVKKAIGNAAIRLSEDDAGTLRAIDAMRDDEQHWFNLVSEHILYLHARCTPVPASPSSTTSSSEYSESASPITSRTVCCPCRSTHRRTWSSCLTRSTARFAGCSHPDGGPATKPGRASARS